MNKSVTIIGGGITGLCIAYYLLKAEYKVIMLEKSDQLGGLLSTFKVGGQDIEKFYHHHFTHDEELMELLTDLGIRDKCQEYNTTMGFFSGGVVYNFNNAFDLFGFRPLPFLDKIRFGFTSLILARALKWHSYNNISAKDWFLKYAGRKVSEVIWLPMLKVKFGEFYDRVPLAWMIGRMRQRLNSRKTGKEKLSYIDGSLTTLVNRLCDVLMDNPNFNLRTKAVVSQIITEDNKVSGLEMSDGSRINTELVISTVATPVLTKLLDEKSKSLKTRLAEVQYFGAVCGVVVLDKRLNDIYWLNIADNNYPFGGVIEHTNMVPAESYAGNHIVYLSKYYSHTDSLSIKNDDEILEEMIRGLKKIYPELSDDNIKEKHLFRGKYAAPVCDLNFNNKIEPFNSSLTGLNIVNMSHLYPDERSVNNSIRLALQVTAKMTSAEIKKSKSLAGYYGF